MYYFGRSSISRENELTITEWDPVSKHPLFKMGVCRAVRVADADGLAAPAPTTTASGPRRRGPRPVPETEGGDRAGVTETVQR